MTEVVPFEGDRNAILLWDNFTSIPANLIRRLVVRNSEDEEWRVGLSYRQLEGLRLTDLSDMTNIGVTHLNATLEELRTVFLTFEKEGHDGSIELYFEMSEEEEELSIDEIDVAETLYDLVNSVLEAFDSFHKFDKRTEAILRGRNSALLHKLRTLDDIGIEFGVTRERIRQIEGKYTGLLLAPPKHENVLFSQILDILEISDDESDFVHRVDGEGLLGGESISLAKLRALLTFCQLDDYLLRLEEIEASWENRERDRGDLAFRVRAARNKFGLIDLSYLKSQTGVSDIAAFEAILSKYSRSIMKGHVVLARTSKLDTSFENALGKQLLVFGELDAENLLIGIERQARFRRVSLPGSRSELTAIVKELAGNQPNYETFRANTNSEPELSDTDIWFCDQFQNAPTGMLHRNEITAAAIRDGRNVNSVGIFLIFNPLIRAVGVAVLALANLNIEPEMAKQYANITKSIEEKTALEYSFQGEKILLVIRPNLNTISAGVLFPPQDLREMIKNISFDQYCACGHLETKQQLRFHPPSFWTGFTASIKHAMKSHDYKKEIDIKVLLDFDAHSALLIPS